MIVTIHSATLAGEISKRPFPLFQSSCHLPTATCQLHTVETSPWSLQLLNVKQESLEYQFQKRLVHFNFCGNRTRVYRFSSRRSISLDPWLVLNSMCRIGVESVYRSGFSVRKTQGYWEKFGPGGKIQCEHFRGYRPNNKGLRQTWV